MDQLTCHNGLLARIAQYIFRWLSGSLISSKETMAKQAVFLLIRALLIGLALNFTINYAASLSQSRQSDIPDTQTTDSTLNQIPPTAQRQTTD